MGSFRNKKTFGVWGAFPEEIFYRAWRFKNISDKDFSPGGVRNKVGLRRLDGDRFFDFSGMSFPAEGFQQVADGFVLLHLTA